MNVGIDFSILLHSNYHVAKKLGDVNSDILADMCVVSIDKLARDLCTRLNRIPNIYVCTDTGTSWRRTLHPGYKASRIPNQEFLDCAIPARSKIRSLGYKVLELDGLEADDWGFLIAALKQPCVIVSNDNDWKQMILSDDVLYFKFKTKEFLTCDSIDIWREAFDKLVLGCPSDEIPRILPKSLRRGYIDYLFNDVERFDEGDLIQAIIRACSHNNIVIDKKQLVLNQIIANYSIENLRKQFFSNWDDIMLQLEINY